MANRSIKSGVDEKILKNADFFIDPELPVNILRRDPQPEFQLHSHEFSELVIVYAGRGIHFTDNGESALKAGDVFVINGGKYHGFKELRGLKLINIIFSLKNLESPLSDLPLFPAFHILFTLEPEFGSANNYSKRLNLNPEQLAKSMEIIELMEQEIALPQQAGRVIMVSALFMQLAAFLIRAYEKLPPDSSSNSSKLGKVFAYIRKNFRKPLKVKELAQIASMSESTLTRAFVKSVGLAPVAYCCQRRIHHSINLLVNSDMSISEIAADCGFEDSNYFTRIFRQHTGRTPREYRKFRNYL